MSEDRADPRCVGVVGLGNVGLPASINLLRAGYRVIGYSRSTCPAFVEAGGRQVDTLAELGGCAVIVQALPTSEALVSTIDGLLPVIGAGVIVADISSYPLDIKRAQAARVASRGAVMLDGEISGLPFQVAARSAVLFLAGNRAAIEQASGIFDAIAEKRFFLGAFGAATRMKLIANFMVCAHNLVGAEALTLARAAGLDLDQTIQVLAPSAAGSTTFTNKAPAMVARTFDSGKGPFSHMFGYLDRAAALGSDLGIGGATPLLDRTREIYGIARDQGRHQQDIAAIIEIVEQLGGAEP